MFAFPTLVFKACVVPEDAPFVRYTTTGELVVSPPPNIHTLVLLPPSVAQPPFDVPGKRAVVDVVAS